MKLARCTDGGAPFWAVVDAERGELRPIAGDITDWGPALSRGEGEAALRFNGPVRALATVRLLPPVAKTNRVVVAGANYAKHLAADFGERQLAGAALQQAHAQVRLQPGDAARQARLRQAQHPGGGREAAAVRDHGEVAVVVQVGQFDWIH